MGETVHKYIRPEKAKAIYDRLLPAGIYRGTNPNAENASCVLKAGQQFIRISPSEDLLYEVRESSFDFYRIDDERDETHGAILFGSGGDWEEWDRREVALEFSKSNSGKIDVKSVMIGFGPAYENEEGEAIGPAPEVTVSVKCNLDPAINTKTSIEEIVDILESE